VAKQPVSRSPLAEAIEWGSRITTIGFSFAIPPLVGFGLDRWLSWTPVATLAGVVLGFAAGMLQTVNLARHLPARTVRRSGRSARDPDEPGSGPAGTE
jgi:hypothetical protein